MASLPPTYDYFLELYSSFSPERRNILITKVAGFKKELEFLLYVESKISQLNKISPQSQFLFNMLVDYVVAIGSDIIFPDDFFLSYTKLLTFMPRPDDYNKYSRFLTILFLTFNDELTLTQFNDIDIEYSIYPIICLSVSNPKYQEIAYEKLFTHRELLFSKKQHQIWFKSAIKLLMSPRTIDVDISAINDMLEQSLSESFVDFSTRLQLLSAVMVFIKREDFQTVFNSFFFSSIARVDSQSFVSALNLASIAISRVDDRDLVIDAVFKTIIKHYQPSAENNDSLASFCHLLSDDLIKEVIKGNTSIPADARYFLVARYPTDDTLPTLFNENSTSAYIALIHYMMKNACPTKYLALLMNSLHAADLKFIPYDDPVSYCYAAISCLSKTNDPSKISFFADVLHSKEELPLVSSRFVYEAFLNASERRIRLLTEQRHVHVLLDYLFQSLQYYAEGDEADFLLPANIEQKGMFKQDEPSQISHTEAIKEWSFKSPEISSKLLQMSMEKKLTTTAVSLTDDPEKIHELFLVALKDKIAIKIFFSSLMLCAPARAVAELDMALQNNLIPNELAMVTIYLSGKHNLSYSPELHALIKKVIGVKERPKAISETIEKAFKNAKGIDCTDLIEIIVPRYPEFTVEQFINSLTVLIKANTSLSPQLAQQISEVWIIDICAGDIKESTFEQFFLDARYKKQTLPALLKAIEAKLLTSLDCLPAILSLLRVINLQTATQKELQRFIPIFIASIGNPNKSVAKAAIDGLTSILGIHDTPTIHGDPFSNEFLSALSDFFIQISSNYQGETVVLLADALIGLFVKRFPEWRGTIACYFSVIVNKNVSLFLESGKFIQQILSIENLSPILYKCMQNILDVLFDSDVSAFMKQFIDVPRNSFWNQYAIHLAKSIPHHVSLFKWLTRKCMSVNKEKPDIVLKLIILLQNQTEAFISSQSKFESLGTLILAALNLMPYIGQNLSQQYSSFLKTIADKTNFVIVYHCDNFEQSVVETVACLDNVPFQIWETLLPVFEEAPIIGWLYVPVMLSVSVKFASELGIKHMQKILSTFISMSKKSKPSNWPFVMKYIKFPPIRILSLPQINAIMDFAIAGLMQSNVVLSALQLAYNVYEKTTIQVPNLLEAIDKSQVPFEVALPLVLEIVKREKVSTDVFVKSKTVNFYNAVLACFQKETAEKAKLVLSLLILGKENGDLNIAFSALFAIMMNPKPDNYLKMVLDAMKIVGARNQPEPEEIVMLSAMVEPAYAYGAQNVVSAFEKLLRKFSHQENIFEIAIENMMKFSEPKTKTVK